MTLGNALDGIKAKSYFHFCGVNYSGLKFHEFDRKNWDELAPIFQLGIKRLIVRIWEIQNVLFFYEFDYIIILMKSAGIKLKGFFESCGLNKSFYSNKYFTANNFGEYLFKIRIALIRIINQLIKFTIS